MGVAEQASRASRQSKTRLFTNTTTLGAGHQRLVRDLSSPPPSMPAPAVVYLHHGGWRSGDRSYGMYPWHGPILAAHGFVVGCVSYRLSSVAPFPAQLHDAKAAIRWLRANAAAFGVDPDHIGAWGDSAGGHLAALLATTDDRPDLEGSCGSPGWSSIKR